LCSCFLLVSSIVLFSFRFCWARQHHGRVLPFLLFLWENWEQWLIYHIDLDLLLGLTKSEDMMNPVGNVLKLQFQIACWVLGILTSCFVLNIMNIWNL
jgi:hypothetical protein